MWVNRCTKVPKPFVHHCMQGQVWFLKLFNRNRKGCSFSVFINMYLLCPCSSFPDSKEQYPDFPFKNGGMAGAIELKRPVGAHCHGTKAPPCEESVDKLLAKKKLYIASAVCLVFMIGEVIGKSLGTQTSGIKEKRRSDICISVSQK